MADMRIGGSGDPGLDRFQALRDQALRRMRRGEMEFQVQELIQKKRGTEGTAPAQAAEAAGPYAKLAGVAAAKSDVRPHLGQILDILA
jgi:hypothetical protein